MKKRHARPLVLGYIERVSSKAFENFPRQITHLAGRQHGLYALYKSDRLYYVGLALNLRSRVKSHLKDKHRGKWDRFSLFLIRHADHIKEMESLVLRIAAPAGNTQSGGLRNAKNLLRKMKTLIRDEQDRQLEIVVGDASAQRDIRSSSPIAKAWRRRKRQQKRALKQRADTIVVPAHEQGFQSVFLGTNCWHAVRISDAMSPKVKYIAVYRTRPISAITHYARVSRIEKYRGTDKSILYFKGRPREIKPVALGNRAPLRGQIYTALARLRRARELADL